MPNLEDLPLIITDLVSGREHVRGSVSGPNNSSLRVRLTPHPLPAQAESVALCCALKPLCSWHALETATTCRERCGGQGYLSCNRFGQIIGFGHAGVTAEGDNRVLMQKVAKERMLELQQGKLRLPEARPLRGGVDAAALAADLPALLVRVPVWG
jgi:hypothetical protein